MALLVMSPREVDTSVSTHLVYNKEVTAKEMIPEIKHYFFKIYLCLHYF